MQTHSEVLQAGLGLELHRSIRIHGPRQQACRFLEDVAVWPSVLARLTPVDDGVATSHQVASLGAVTLEWTAEISSENPVELVLRLSDGPDGPRSMLTAELHFHTIIEASDAVAELDVVDDLLCLREYLVAA